MPRRSATLVESARTAPPRMTAFIPPSPVTAPLIDVARLAGVSQATVSNVLNGARGIIISPDKRERVLRAVTQLDYQPHEAARSLRSRSSHVIGMTIPESHNLHYLDIATGVESYAREQGYTLSFSVTSFDAAVEQQCITRLKQHGYDALIFTSAPGNTHYNDVHALFRKGYPITVVGYNDAYLDSVATEPMVGEKQIFEHLTALGHQHIAYIYGVVSHELLDERLERCLEIQRNLALPLLPSYIRRCGPTINDGYQATQALLNELPQSEWPTALIVVNDLLAIGVISALRDAHVAVPNEMSVVSFDDIPLAAHVTPPLTTVACDTKLMGIAAARLTVARLSDPQKEREHIHTKTHLIVRQSTGPVRDRLIFSRR